MGGSGGGGGRGGGQTPVEFQKKGAWTGPQFLEGSCWERRVAQESENSLKNPIFMGVFPKNQYVGGIPLKGGLG